MKKVLLIWILAVFASAAPQASALEVLVIQGYKVKPYETALRGFKSVCTREATGVTFSEHEPSGDLVKNIRRVQPDLILAIGAEALHKVKRIKNIPVLYLMVLSSDLPASLGTNITGIGMRIGPEKQLSALKTALPSAKRVGLLFDPEKTGPYVKRAMVAARALGLEITAKEIRSAKDVPKTLLGMRGDIDAFWILPDITVVTPETTSFMLLFCIENKVPVLAFSSRFLDMGALLSVEIDPYDAGKQAGEMAIQILSGTDITKVPPADAANAVISLNVKAAKKMGIKLNDEIQSRARIFK